MRDIVLIAIAAVVVSPLVPTRPAGAQIEYPWCAQYSGGGNGGGRNCGFSTIEQCRATISGIGGFCEPNLFYPGSASGTPKSKSKGEHIR